MNSLKELSRYKKIAMLIHPNKKCSSRVLICTDDPDCWFITIINYQGQQLLRNDKIGLTRDAVIIAKDLPGVLSNWHTYGGYGILIRTKHKSRKLNKFITEYLPVMEKLITKQK